MKLIYHLREEGSLISPPPVFHLIVHLLGWIMGEHENEQLWIKAGMKGWKSFDYVKISKNEDDEDEKNNDYEDEDNN